MSSEKVDSGTPGRSVSRFFLRGGSAALLARLLAVGAGLAVQMLLARLLDPEVFGAYFLSQSVVAFLALIGQLGLPRMLVREIARAMGEGRPGLVLGTLRTAIRIATVGISGVALLYALALGPALADHVFASAAMATTIGVAAAWSIAMACQNLAAEALRGLHRVGEATLLGGALSSALTALGLLLILWTRGRCTLEDVIALSTAMSFLSFLLAARILGRRLRGVRTQPVATQTLLAGTTAMLIAGIGQAGAAQSDLWIIGAFLSESDVAVYGAAKRLMRLVSLPMVIVTLVVPPVIADLYHRGETRRLERVMRGVTTVAAAPSLLVLILFALQGERVLGLLYGDFYTAGASILAILSLERLLFVWAGPCGMTLLMTGHERRLMGVTLIAGLVEVIGVWAGATVGGVVGAALGFLAGSGLRNLATWDQARRATGLRSDLSLHHLRESLGPLRSAFRARDP